MYVKPFWDEQKGVNNDGAIALTVLTALVGISSATGMGNAAGNCVDKIFGSSIDTNRLPAQERHITHYHEGNNHEMSIFQPQQTVRAVVSTAGSGDVESNKQSTQVTATAVYS